jgi:hypothetical protein
MNTIEIIHNHQLMYAKYDIATLEYNIDRLSLRNLLKTQTLTPAFCIKFLLDPATHGMDEEDNYISKEDILLYQPHITPELLR